MWHANTMALTIKWIGSVAFCRPSCLAQTFLTFWGVFPWCDSKSILLELQRHFAHKFTFTNSLHILRASRQWDVLTKDNFNHLLDLGNHISHLWKLTTPSSCLKPGKKACTWQRTLESVGWKRWALHGAKLGRQWKIRIVAKGNCGHRNVAFGAQFLTVSTLQNLTSTTVQDAPVNVLVGFFATWIDTVFFFCSIFLF